MQDNRQAITGYYIVVLTLLAVQAMFTVYQLSQSIGFGQRISQLNTQKANMMQEKGVFKKQLAETQSLYVLEYDVEEEFVPISNSIQVSGHTNVASR